MRREEEMRREEVREEDEEEERRRGGKEEECKVKKTEPHTRGEEKNKLYFVIPHPYKKVEQRCRNTLS